MYHCFTKRKVISSLLLLDLPDLERKDAILTQIPAGFHIKFRTIFPFTETLGTQMEIRAPEDSIIQRLRMERWEIFA